MYIEIGSRQSGKTTRMLQDILYNVMMIKDIKIVILSGNHAFNFSMKQRLNDIFNRNKELNEKYKKNFIFINMSMNKDEFYEQYLSLSLIFQTSKHYKVYCDEFLYAKNAHNFLIDKIKNVEGFKDKLYLTASPDLNGKHKEIFKQFIELNNNEYININYKFLNDLMRN